MARKKIITKSNAKKLSKTWWGLILLACLLGYQFYQENKPIETAKRFEVTLNQCVDGDTAWFNVDHVKTKVRFLYIDTPESTTKVEPYGKEASDYVKNKLEHATTIELELNKEGDRYDKYDRLLAWVFVDGTLLQQDIARQGYCQDFYDYGYAYTYKSIIIEANEEAKIQKRGIYEK